MKVAFIADIHSNYDALKAVLNEIRKMKIKKVYCLGDIVGYGAEPKKCLDIIRKMKIKSVKGNHEWAVVSGKTSWFNPLAAASIDWQRKNLSKEDLDYLKNLSEKMELKIANYKTLVVHGSPYDPLFHYVFPADVTRFFLRNLNYVAIGMGHTHIPFVKNVADKLVFNCGSVGQPRDGINKASFAVFDSKKFSAEIFRVDYDIKSAAKKIVDAGLPKFHANRLFLGI